jgi:hypothetical protein
MRMVLAALLVAVVTAVGAVTDAGARKRHKCPARQGHTLARTDHARVWMVGDTESGAEYFGCLRANGRVRRLSGTDGCFHTCDTVARPVRLKGRFVAWVHEASFSYGGGAPSNESQAVEVYALKTGRQVLTTQVYFAESADSGTRVTGAPLAGLLLDPHGTVAFLSGSTLRRMSIGDSGPSAIDSGAIDPKSLRLAGELLTWTNAGQAKSASLR